MVQDQPTLITYTVESVKPSLTIASEIGRNEYMEIRTILKVMRDIFDFSLDSPNFESLRS